MNCKRLLAALAFSSICLPVGAAQAQNVADTPATAPHGMGRTDHTGHDGGGAMSGDRSHGAKGSGGRRGGDAPAQADAASKTAHWATVSAKAPEVQKAIRATDLAAAAKAAGKPGAFVGTVADIYASRGNRMTKLDFDPDFKKAASAVVFPSTYAALPSMQTLKGKRVLVTGPISEYHGSYEIIVSSPSQVKIVR